ncbi:flagellar hook capping FlgD N-terminal domain-containing protein [Thalassococcus sp. S3]|uniref:flagellar hook capping FlgD N-terminal domain-containing protein n=1 Tax=Thalassococcus sp. S3 TaxID=2017482 RepID=UPI001023FEAD|nr:flagellar hook capping FlgD N-terminal domain-containing protein [Thalassococcus sp. S3]QBF29717.1 flagellar basal body rod modification protein [Thalassococcus sp. S3]
MELNPALSNGLSSAPASTSGSATSLASDFDTFLQMLTAQARYQDPLEPIDSSEYSAQLAQFSMVEQQVRTNDLLGELGASLGSSNIASLAGWVGMEARAVAPMRFEGKPITISPNPASISDNVDLVVLDAEGEEVARKQIPVSSDPVTWDGTDNDGDTLPFGTYSFKVESFAKDELLISDPAEVYGRITEAQALNGETVLIFEGGTAVLSSHVTALRQAGT